MKKTLVLGASENIWRYSYRAVNQLLKHQYEVVAIGKRDRNIFNIKIEVDKIPLHNIHTVAMYLNINNQIEYYDYIISLQPTRVIFNPGAENSNFSKVLKENNIEVLDACVLVLLSTNQY